MGTKIIHHTQCKSLDTGTACECDCKTTDSEGIVDKLRICICDNGVTREAGGNPMSGGYVCPKCELQRKAANEIESLRTELAEAKLAFEIYASFGGYHPNTGNDSSYYLQADGVEVENDGWSDSRTYPVGEKFDKLTIESVIKAAFVVRGKGGTFGDTFDSRLTARSAMQEGK